MADFHQSNSVSTLHRLRRNRLNTMELELTRFSRHTGIGLVLPALITEFERPAMRRICRELRTARYFNRIVVAIGRATRSQVAEAAQFFEGFRSPVSLLWIEDPKVQAVFRKLENHGLPANADGKGRTCWLSMGYLLAEGQSDIIALHDCDIVNYNREMPASLCYPLAHPNMDFDFCKGYYARVSDRLHGRVTRLFLAPLLQAAKELAPSSSFLSFLSEFRYPLAGEFSMKSSLASKVKLPTDWGLEVGILSEAFKHSGPARVCQADIADNYEHKHQEVSANDSSKGLRRMTIDITKALLRCMEAQGAKLSRNDVQTLDFLYRRFAANKMKQYEADALMNGLTFDYREEESAIQSFSKSLTEAACAVSDAQVVPNVLPTWEQVNARIPELSQQLLDCAIPMQQPVRSFLPNWIQRNAKQPVLAERTA